MNWKNKKVLVTGSEGMIGRELVIQLKELGVEVQLCDIKMGKEFDVIDYNNCLEMCQNMDYVFHLFGIKGNPKMTKERPVDFMGPMLQGDTNMILASLEANVKRFLYTSSIAVENPESDKYPAWAKLTGEKLIEAMKIQYPNKTKYVIVRPSNVYGRFDNLNRKDNMVVTSLISKAITDGKLIMDNKGSKQIRDFINAKDVARNMIKVIEELPNYPVNLCSGEGVKIKEIANIISKELDIPIKYKDLNLTLGPDVKLMKLNWDFQPEIRLEEGIREVINYARNM